MSKEQKELLKKLDILNTNIQTLTQVIAVSIGKEALFKEKKEKNQQIEFLLELGLSRNIIASIVSTTPLSVSVTKSEKKSKTKMATKNNKLTEETEKTNKT
jgi:hypothetical protein